MNSSRWNKKQEKRNRKKNINESAKSGEDIRNVDQNSSKPISSVTSTRKNFPNNRLFSHITIRKTF